MRRLWLLLPLVFILAPEHNRQVPGSPGGGDHTGGVSSATPWEPDRAVAFLEDTVARYEREVAGYQVTLVKEERVNGALLPEERVVAWFREKPFSVRMEWKQGGGLAQAVLFVEGENEGKLLAQPAGLLALAGIKEYEPDSPEAKGSSRYPISEFGIQKGTLRTLKYWKLARDRGDLKVWDEGLVQVKELGGQTCRKIRRRYASPEGKDGITEAVFYFDPASGLQVGSVLLDARRELIGRYFFRDLRLNPEYPAGVFTRAGLGR